MNRLQLACAWLTLSAFIVHAKAQQFQGLGFLSQFRSSIGLGINADGSVVIGSAETGDGHHAFRWTASGGMQDLGIVPAYGHLSTPSAITADGMIVVGYLHDFSFSLGAGFQWMEAGGIHALMGSQDCTDISADGGTITGRAGHDFGSLRAFRWTEEDGIQDLGVLPDATGSAALGISADGRIIVGYSNPSFLFRAWRWTAETGMQPLALPPGAEESEAVALSADGSIVVGQSGPRTGDRRVCRWDDVGNVEELEGLPGATQTRVRRTSADGSVIIGTSRFPDRAFIWTASLGVVDLNQYFPMVGIDLAGWVLTEGNGVSADGRVMTGRGIHDGSTEAWLATLPPACAPDFDMNGVVDSQDFFGFLAAFFASQSGADFNADTVINSQDFFDFLAAFFTGC